MLRFTFFGATCSAILTGLGILPTPSTEELPDFSLSAISLPEQPTLLADLTEIRFSLPEIGNQVEERITGVVSAPEPNKPQLPEVVEKASVTAPVSASGIVHFELDMIELDAEAKAALDAFSANLLADNSTKIEIFGHTDLTGSEDYNSILGLRRANQVATYLIERGVGEDRIHRIVSWGEASPVVKTEAPTRENRRVNIAMVHNI